MTTPFVHSRDEQPEIKDALPAVALADLTERMQQACADVGWDSLMPVQSKSILYLMAGRDLMVQSRTGSGKTGAFILPLLERLNLRQDATQALVLVPTRELAQQVAAEAERLGRSAGMSVMAIYGGAGYREQLKALDAGTHLIVGTPGRIIDHLNRGTLRFDALKMLIFDEADRMLSMGFMPDVQEIRTFLPSHRVETHMFSATFPPRVLHLSRIFMHEPSFLSLSRDHVHVTDVSHVFHAISGIDKDRVLVRLLELENPSGALIFCNTKARVEYVTVVLRRFGYNADLLTSDLSQSARETILQRFRDGKLRFLVCTDVAARGIDIPDLSHVIQFEPPEDPEQYIHRAGRTGRAGASGRAITLTDPLERLKLRRIGQQYSIEFEELPTPTDEDVAEEVGERATVLLENRLRHLDGLKRERLRRFRALVAKLSTDEEGRDILAMLVDDAYHQSAHETPEQAVPQSLKNSQEQRKRRRRSRRRK